MDAVEGQGKAGSARSRIAIGIVIGAIALAVVGRYAWRARLYESTDDAFVDGTIVRVAPQVGGRVTRVAVGSNDRVAVGDTLVEIDPADLQIELAGAQARRAEAEGHLAQAQAQIAVAQAAVDQAHANVAVASADASNAAADLRRYQRVSRGAVSEQALDNASTLARRSAAALILARSGESAAQAQLVLAESQAKTATAEVASAAVSIDQAKLQLSYTVLRAPSAGHVTMKSVEVGDLVQIGQSLMALVADDAWVIANFKETQLTYMKPGQPVAIHVDAFPDPALHGQVESIQAGAAARFSLMPPENATGNYVKVVQRVPVRIRIDEPAERVSRLAPGMSVVPEVKVR